MKRALISTILISLIINSTVALAASGDQKTSSQPRGAPTSETSKNPDDKYLQANAAYLAQMRTSQSGRILRSYVNKSELVDQAVVSVQNENLKTLVDKQVTMLLETDPVLAQVKPMLILALEDNIKESFNKGDTTMTWVTAFNTSKELREFYEVMNEVGVSFCFTDEEIINSRYYRAEGPVNAYTTSALKKYLTFVVYKALQEILSREQLKAVISHELGHIMAGHILHSVMSAAISIQIFNQLTSGNSTNFHPDDIITRTNLDNLEALVKLDRDTAMEPNLKSFWLNQFEMIEGGIAATLGFSYEAKPQMRMAYLKLVRDTVMGIEKYSNNVPRKVKTKDVLKAAMLGYETAIDQEGIPLKRKLMIRFLAGMSQILRSTDAPKQLVENNIRFANDLATAESDESIPKYERSYVAGILSANLSQVSIHYEATADNYGASTTNPLFAAATFGSFAGGEIERNVKAFGDRDNRTITPLRVQIKHIIEQVKTYIDQIARVYRSNSEDTRRGLFGSPHEDHPLRGARAVRFMKIGNRLEIVAMKNDFLKLVLVQRKIEEDGLRLVDEMTNLKKYLSTIRSNDPKGAELLNEGKEQLAMKAARFKEVSETGISLGSDIMSEIIFKTVDGKKIERKVDVLNDRIKDIVDYALAEKQRASKRMEMLEAIIAHEQDTQKIEILKAQLQGQTNEFTRSWPLLDKVADYLGKLVYQHPDNLIAKNRLEEIKLYYLPEKSVKNLALISDARARIRNDNQFRKSDLLIEIDVIASPLSAMVGEFFSDIPEAIQAKTDGEGKASSAGITGKTRVSQLKLSEKCLTILDSVRLH